MSLNSKTESNIAKAGTQSSDPPVAVVCVTYNRREALLVLLGQLRSIDYDPASLDIFLVDNASTDGTQRAVRKAFPEVYIVENKTNSGVSAGFNRSIQEALSASREYKYLWLLDSDAEVEPFTLREMVVLMERHADIGVAGSAVYDPQSRARLVTAGLRVAWRQGDIPLFVPREENRPETLDVDLIPACSMLTRASVYARVGLWDDRFPLYWGDTDWCTRVKRAGHRVCCVPHSRVWHRDWSSVPRGFGAEGFIRDHVRGALLYFVRHSPDTSLRGARRLMIKTLLKSGLEQLTMRKSYALAYRQAVNDLLAGDFQPGMSSRPLTGNKAVALDKTSDRLATLVPKNATILLNQLRDDELQEMVKIALARNFPNASWKVIPPDSMDDGQWTEYRAFKPRQLVRYIWRRMLGFRGADINVCHISNPLLYNFLAGRYTLLVDDSGNAVFEPNRPIVAAWEALSAPIIALRSAYFDLPRALRNNSDLRNAVPPPEADARLTNIDVVSVPDA